MTLATGQILKDRYRVAKLLGQGGFGAVYRAWDVTLNTPCALKENFEITEAGQKQFLTEARILAGLRHPNLPRVTDYFVLPGQGQYLVMDFVEGDDLKTLMERTKAPLLEAQALSWIRQVCEAIEFLHTQEPPIIHRDIKPANIKINPRGQAVLVDFGIAKLYSASQKTTMGARAVTPGYSPPEQYGLGSTDARSDIYALGATLYHLLTNQEPIESIQRTIGLKIDLPRKLNPGLSVKVEKAVLKAMELVPERRFSAITEFERALPVSTRSGKPDAIPSTQTAATPQQPPSVSTGTQVVLPASPDAIQTPGSPTNLPATTEAVPTFGLINAQNLAPSTEAISTPVDESTFLPVKKSTSRRWVVFAAASLASVVLVSAISWLLAKVVIPEIDSRRVSVSKTQAALAASPTIEASHTPTITLFPTHTSLPASSPTPTLALPVAANTQLPAAQGIINTENLDQLRMLAYIETNSPFPDFEWIADSSAVIIAAQDGIAILEVRSLEVKYSLKVPSPVICLAASPDRKKIAAGAVDGNAYLWLDMLLINSNRQPSHVLKIASGSLELVNNQCNLAFSSDSNYLFTATANQSQVGKWQIDTGVLKQRFLPNTKISALTLLKDHMAVGTITGRVYVIPDVTVNNPVVQDTGLDKGKPINSLSFSPDLEYLAIAYKNKLTSWIMSQKREIPRNPVSTMSMIVGVDYSPTRSFFACGVDFGKVDLYSGSDLDRLFTLFTSKDAAESGNPVRRMMFSPDGRYLGAMTHSGAFILWGIFTR